MLTTRMQIQIIADRLAGLPVPDKIGAAFFFDPWLTCWKAIDASEPYLAHHALTQALATFGDRERILQTILSAQPGFAPQFPSLQEISPSLPPIQWLWPRWIPLGMLTILGASQGAGKSFVALDLAYRVIHNLPFPDGTTFQPPGQDDPAVPGQQAERSNCVLYIDAESVPQVLDDRAKSYQLDRSRLFVMLPDPYEMIDFGSQKYKDRLIEMITTLKPVLVIIDSFSSIHSKGQNNVEDVRELFSFLSQVASSFQVALLLITHIRKPSFGLGMMQYDISLEDITGSAHVTRMGRTVLGMHVIQTGPVFDPNGPRRFKMLKSTVGAVEKPLSFEFAPLEPEGVYLKWICDPPKPFQEPTKTEECACWLIDTLAEAGKPVSPKDVIELAEERGFSRRTVYRARDLNASHIRNTHGRTSSENKWEFFTREGSDGQEPGGKEPGGQESASKQLDDGQQPEAENRKYEHYTDV